MEERYWLRVAGLPWQEATREQFIQAERAAGLYPKPGCGDVATAGFSAESVEGMVTWGEITEEAYGWDPDFLKVTRKEE